MKKVAIVSGLIISLILASSLFMWLKAPKTITLGFYSDSSWGVRNDKGYSFIDHAIKEFEKQNPNVKIKYESGIRQKNYLDWLSDKIISNQTPDVYLVSPKDLGYLASIGAMQNLDPALHFSKFDTKDYYPVTLEAGRYNGHQYALPLEADPTVLCVNTDLLKKEGITVPRSGFTLEEFYQICRQVTKDTNNDGTLDQFGFADYSWKDTVQAYGAHLFSTDGSKSYFNSKQVRQALVMSEKFYNLQKGAKVSADDFDQGKVAFLPMTLAQYRTYKSYPYRIARYSSFRWTCIKMPAIDPKVRSTAVETSTLALSSHSKHPILALRFLKFLSADKKIQARLLEDSQGASVLTSVMNGPKTQALLAQGIKDDNALTTKNYAEIMDNATVTPKFRHYSNVMEKADYLIERALNEGDIDAQLSDIQKQIQVELEK